MKIGLASYEFRNNDIAFNLGQIERGIKEVGKEVDLLCFGEAFLQGFNSLSWDFDVDKTVAVSQDSAAIRSLCDYSRKYEIDLIVGYIELAANNIFSSCAVIEDGRLTHNYRRISRGWKEFWKTDDHYKEGEDVVKFLYKGNLITLALCGDLWDYPEKFRTEGLLIWPVYVNLEVTEWRQAEERAYAHQAALVANRTFMVDSFCRISEPNGVAGTFYFENGLISKRTEYGIEDILIIDM